MAIFFSLRCLPLPSWPHDNCACVPQLFQQLINYTLRPAFLRKFVCQPFCHVPLQIQTFFIKILSFIYNQSGEISKFVDE